MILVVGGAGSGKLDYVKNTLGYTAADIADAVLDNRPVLNRLHDLLRENKADAQFFERICAKDVVLCNEVGCGVVPISADERAWRDTVGRVSAQLAGRADMVVRLCCGIPMTIKDRK